jgi:hypothetical protein
MNSVATGNAVPQTAPTAQASPTQQSGGGYNQVMNQRMGRGLGGFGSFGNFGGGFGGGGGMPFNISGYGGMDAGLGGYGGFGGFNPMMMGGFGGFSPMMGFGGFGGFNPMMMGGFGFNPMMAMGLGAFGGYGGFGFNPMMMMGGYGNQFAQQQEQPDFPPQMAQRYNPNVYNPRENAQRQMQQQFQQRESSMTDYQKLMERQRTANMPRPPSSPSMSGGFGLEPLPVTAPSEFEIANSLGFKDPNAGWWMTTDVKPKQEYERMEQQRNAQAKEYLNSIGYGQSGFDASKYEVKRQPVSTGPRTGLGLFLGA